MSNYKVRMYDNDDGSCSIVLDGFQNIHAMQRKNQGQQSIKFVSRAEANAFTSALSSGGKPGTSGSGSRQSSQPSPSGSSPRKYQPKSGSKPSKTVKNQTANPTERQQGFLQELVEEHSISQKTLNSLANEIAGKPMNQLNRQEFSLLIDRIQGKN